MRLSRKVILD